MLMHDLVSIKLPSCSTSLCRRMEREQIVIKVDENAFIFHVLFSSLSGNLFFFLFHRAFSVQERTTIFRACDVRKRAFLTEKVVSRFLFLVDSSFAIIMIYYFPTLKVYDTESSEKNKIIHLFSDEELSNENARWNWIIHFNYLYCWWCFEVWRLKWVAVEFNFIVLWPFWVVLSWKSELNLI